MKISLHQTTSLSGQATVPGSKSQTIRGIVFALLASGRSQLNNALDSDDTKDAMRVCQQLGADITSQGNRLIIDSPGLPLVPHALSIDSGNSGITLNFNIPLLGLRQDTSQPVVWDCGEQMRARPIQPLVDALKNLGLSGDYLHHSGSCPIRMAGKLRGGITQVDGLSSQYLSALLIALPCAENDSQVTTHDLHERPYLDMTLRWLAEQRIEYTHKQLATKDVFNIQGRQRYQPFDKTIAADFSSASYLIAAATLLPGRVELNGIDMLEPQGDKRLVYILQEMGADITIEPQRLLISGGKPLTGIPIDAKDIPDLLPTLAVIGTQARGKTDIRNVKQARIKETDRIHSMYSELSQMGARIDEYPDGIRVFQSKLHGARVKGYSDHRTVMALAIAGLLAGSTLIEGAEAIQKTFPTFVEVMRSIGANIHWQTEDTTT